MKKNFLTGLLLILPITLTFIIVAWMINFLTSPFQDEMEAILNHYGILNHDFYFLTGQQVAYLSSKLLVIVLVTLFLVVIGFLGRLVILTSLISFSDYMIAHIPIVNKIYKMIKNIVETVFHHNTDAKGEKIKKGFTQVVAVPYPNDKSFTLALMSEEQKSKLPCETASVFVVGAPNPTFGFMLTCKTSDLIFLDMKVEEALKFILSCGIMCPEFKSQR
jgi:uncharacterized membrane protein